MGSAQSTPKTQQTPTSIPLTSSTPGTQPLSAPQSSSSTSFLDSSPTSFKQTIEDITDALLEVGPWIRKTRSNVANSDFMLAVDQGYSKFDVQIQRPLSRLYCNLPGKLTEAKFQLISPYNYNQRFTVLNALCALTAIYTVSSTRKIGPFSRLLRTTRNAGFVYLIAGLLIAPEIYNPFIKGQ